jgi:hypothetical protein
MKKVVRSVEGEHTIMKRMSPVAVGTSYVRDIARGAQIETIELYYCTALGLVRAGVLPTPPNFELDLVRKEKPFSLNNTTPGMLRCLEVEPTLVVTGAAVEELGIEEKRSAFFDLTGADSDPEEEASSPTTQHIVSPEVHPGLDTELSQPGAKRARLVETETQQ